MRKWSLGFELVRIPLGLWHYLFYKKITFLGKDKIPQDRPIIFGPNHQNALMDACALVFASGMQPVFLARSDIFKNPIIAKILNFLRLFPVYRIRDGASSLNKNDATFDKSVKILEYNKSMAVFPEASHTGFRRLKKLKKGIPRVAFIAENKNDYKLGIEVVPVGIYYSEYQNLKTNLLVKFGDPILVSDYCDIYKENEQKGMAALRERIEDEIKKLIVHIKSIDHYDFYEQIRDICDFEMIIKSGLNHTPGDKLIADQRVISLLEDIEENNPDDFISLKDKTSEYFGKIEKLKINDELFDNESPKLISLLGISLLFVISLPFHLLGVILNYLPYYLIENVIKTIKDAQFRSSFRYVLFFFGFIIWASILGAVFSFIVEIRFSFWIMFFGSIILALFTIRNWFLLKAHIIKWRFYLLNKSKPLDLKNLRTIRKSIIQDVLK